MLQVLWLDRNMCCKYFWHGTTLWRWAIFHSKLVRNPTSNFIWFQQFSLKHVRRSWVLPRRQDSTPGVRKSQRVIWKLRSLESKLHQHIHSIDILTLRSILILNTLALHNRNNSLSCLTSTFHISLTSWNSRSDVQWHMTWQEGGRPQRPMSIGLTPDTTLEIAASHRFVKTKQRTWGN